MRIGYTQPKVIACDVDGTLLIGGEPCVAVIEYLKSKRAEGFTIWLWSARGEAHARKAAERTATTDLFSLITSKPGYIVDDMGRGWTRYMRHISGREISGAGDPPIQQTHCCPELQRAHQVGTDAEGYGPLIGAGRIAGMDLQPLRYCPWCGERLTN